MSDRDLTKSQICITIDVDWAPDEIMLGLFELMRDADLKATIFATHDSPVLKSLDTERFEIGLHPNFNVRCANVEDAVRPLKDLYPQAQGARSHSLHVSSAILQLYLENGLTYESNAHLTLHEGLHPIIRYKGIVSIPMYWSDDTHFQLNRSFNLEELRLAEPGLKVLDFHPIHIFMNTSSAAHYEEYKHHYQEPEKLKDYINRGPGVGTLFQSLLAYIENNSLPTYRLDDICEQYVAGTR